MPPVGSSPDDQRAYGLRLDAVAAGRPVSWLRQVHGSDVVVVRDPGDGTGTAADALVTTSPDVAISVFTADCAPVVLHAGLEHGAVLAVAHAGWKGLLGGVLQATVATMATAAGADLTGRLSASLGPCIGPECYEFGEGDLGLLTERYGPSLRSTTAHGTPALDLRVGVVAALTEVGVSVDLAAASCTGCNGERFFSHRARHDGGRQAVVAWLESVSPVS